MFKIKKSGSYFWPVTVELPVSGGKFDKQTFDAEFKRIGQSEFKALLERDGLNDADACREILIGWKGVHEEDGAEVPFSESARDQLLDQTLVATAIAKAFIDSYTGAKRKNS